MNLSGQNTAASGLGLLDLAEKRLQWLGARQAVLSENVANADTPGWVSRDIKPFADLLASAPSGADMAQTNVLHLPGLITSDQGAALLRGEKAPDGNLWGWFQTGTGIQ